MLETVQRWLTFKSSRVKSVAGVLAVTGLAAGIVVALRSQPMSFSDVNWNICIFIFFVVMPVVVLINAVRFQITSGLIQNKTKLGRALIIATYSTAANMLPLPGGFAVRVANLKNNENTYKKAVMATTYVSLLSAAVTVTMAAFAYNMIMPGQISLILFLFALAILLSTIVLSLRHVGKGSMLKLVATEIFSTLVDASRIVLCFVVIGHGIDAMQSIILTASTVLGSAVSLVPSGLGVREGSAALIAAYIGLEPGTTFIALVISRVLGLGFFMLASLYISIAVKERES